MSCPKVWKTSILALFTRNVRVFVKCQEWIPWQKTMVFTLNICFFLKNRKAKIDANVGGTCEWTFTIMEHYFNWFLNVKINPFKTYIFIVALLIEK